MRTDCWLTVFAYVVSGLLDAVDGYAARALNQSKPTFKFIPDLPVHLGSRFGAMLDMLVDRCATMCLLACLATFYPNYVFLFQMSMLVDIASHWLHLHTSVAGGRQTHKAIDLGGNSVLRFYYHSKKHLICFPSGLISVGGQGLFTLAAFLTAPVAFGKFTISLIQLYAAAVNLAAVDDDERRQPKGN
ncbi:CDP-alcohol phosphatidyltransferase [Opisthorchis viverrini]|uniref:CDP-diacylglycerol--inositol 3-phosphatidyltransferase n=1 Tax=Opisthorchis viverrini TaxID=6198 RepID=A0A1S8WUZ4_OPIVI|nr:CDP-alcohol phosphatidyltransferase [Opisthorchis viverrini]